jgi:hypothetical protein
MHQLWKLIISLLKVEKLMEPGSQWLDAKICLGQVFRSPQSRHTCFAPGYGMKTWLNKLLPFFNSPASLLCFIVSVTYKNKILVLSKLIVE